jgi:thioredoxin 1
MRTPAAGATTASSPLADAVPDEGELRMQSGNVTCWEDLERIVRKGISLVGFTAPWCDPCRAQMPIINELVSVYHDLATIITVDIDMQRTIAYRLGIQSIPTLILFKDGVEIDRFFGLQAMNTLDSALKNATVEAATSRH